MTAPDATPARGDVEKAAVLADWQQVVGNGGPPCFHVENERFCFRAARWDGHWYDGGHNYVSLARFVESLTAERDALAARVRACEADAARYQWLKARNAGLVCAIAYKVKDACAFDNPDDAIDAAIRATVIPRGQW